MTEPVRLNPAGRGRAAETLVQAFRDDPSYTYVFPGEADRVRSLRSLWDATIRFTRIYGEAWTTPEGSGVACWLPPGNAELTFRRLLRTGKLEGVKVGQVWLVNLDSLQEYFGRALSSDDLRFGPKGPWQAPF